MKGKMVILALLTGMFLGGCGSKEAETNLAVTETNINIEETHFVIETTEENQTVKYKEITELSFEDLSQKEFYFASGVGGWRTVMQIEANGDFWGQYSDSNMGESGDGYPEGTIYTCEFYGTFLEPVKVNTYTYSMKVQNLNYKKQPGKTEIIDDTLYCYSTPYGIEGTEEIYVYVPGAPIEDLPEEYINWVRYLVYEVEDNKLPFFGLYNASEQNGFSSYEINNPFETYLANIENASDTIKYALENDPLTQTDMNKKSKELFDLWDGALNFLWGEIKERLLEDEFVLLLEEQRNWIKHKEASVLKAGESVTGGSLYPTVVNSEAARITEERVYELYKLLDY